MFLIPQYQGILKSRPGGQFRISTTEKKLLFSFCYYILVGGLSLVRFGIATKSWYKLTFAFEEYFNCQSRGISLMQPHNCQKILMEIQANSFPGLGVTIFLLLGFAPVINLMFVLNWNRMKEKLSTALFQLCKILPNTADTNEVEGFPT